MDWEDKEYQEDRVDRWTMLHLVTHVMAIEGISISFLKHELMKNHDGHHREPHLAEEMTWS